MVPNSPTSTGSANRNNERFTTEEQLQDTLSKGHMEGQQVIYSNVFNPSSTAAKVPIKVEDANDEQMTILLTNNNN